MTDQTLQTPSVSLPGPPRAIPGKWFALPFGMLLLFSLWLVVSMAFRFQAIMKQLEDSREVWPKAAAIYRDVLDEISRESSSDAWQDVKSAFTKSSIFDEQSVAVKQLLVKLASDPSERIATEKMKEREEIIAVEQSERTRAQLQSGIVGWCTVKGLRLKLPPLFLLD
ncbi:hypothetical protein SH449x_001232 [Pirellulaceae bacterium SH449]